MALAFAAETTVEPEDTRAEIERVLKKAKADTFGFIQSKANAQVAFECNGRRYRFEIEVPTAHDVRYLPDGSPRQQRHLAGARAQLERMRWRVLFHVIKAKLAAVEVGVLTFEQAFLAHALMPSGRTVWEETNDRIALAYQGGNNVPLLDGPNK
jgi:hypothetical protein